MLGVIADATSTTRNRLSIPGENIVMKKNFIFDQNLKQRGLLTNLDNDIGY